MPDENIINGSHGGTGEGQNVMGRAGGLFQGSPTPFVNHGSTFADAENNRISPEKFVAFYKFLHESADPVERRAYDLAVESHDNAAAQFAALPATQRRAEARAVAEAARLAYLKNVSEGMPEEQATVAVQQHAATLTNESAYRLAIPGAVAPGTPGAPGGPAAPSPGGSPQVTTADRGDAIDAYRDAITKANTTYAGANTHVSNPSPSSVVKPVTSVVDPMKTAQATEQNVALGSVRRANAAVADPNDFARTGAALADPNSAFTAANPASMAASQASAAQAGVVPLEQAKQEEVRRLQLENVGRLTEAAEGRGPVADAAKARIELAAKRGYENALGIANQARGDERGSIRRQVALKHSGDVIEAGLGLEERAASDRMGAAQALAGSLQGARETDVGVASKSAELESQRQALNAQLATAVAQGNRDAENTIKAKLAELTSQINIVNATERNKLIAKNLDNQQSSNLADAKASNDVRERNQTNTQRTGELNATEANKILDANANRTTQTGQFNVTQQNNTQARADQQGFDSQNLNNQTGLDVSKLTEDQRIANERLKLDITEAATKAASGLLDQENKDKYLKIAQEQQKLARQRGDREGEKFWFDKIAAILGTVAQVGTMISDPKAKKNIEKIDPADFAELGRAILGSASTYDYKDPKNGAKRQTGAMADKIQETKLGKHAVTKAPDGTLQIDVGAALGFMALACQNYEKSKGAR